MVTQKEAGKKKELPEGQKEKRVLFRMAVVLIGIFILLGGLFAAKTALDIFSEEEAEAEVPSGVAEKGATQSQDASGTTTTSAPGSTGTTTTTTSTSTGTTSPGTTPSTSTGTGTVGTTGTSGTSGGTAPTSTTSGTAPAGGTPPAAAAEEEEPAAAPAAADEPAAEEPPATPTTETNCANSIDDDADGNMDYADRDCIGSTDGCSVVGGVQTQVVWSYVPEEDPAGIPSRRGCCAATQCRQAGGICTSFDMLATSNTNTVCGIGNNWDRCGPAGDARYNKHAGDISEGGDYVCNGVAWVDEYPETSCRDGVDNDGDGSTDGVDLDCLGKLCEPAPSKKVWIWSYILTRQSGESWRLSPDSVQPGLRPAEATIAPSGTATRCIMEVYCPNQWGTANREYTAHGVYLCVPGTYFDARYKNSDLRCDAASNGNVFDFGADGRYRCNGVSWSRLMGS